MEYVLLFLLSMASARPASWIHSLHDPSTISELENFILESKEQNKFSSMEERGTQHILDLRKPMKNYKRNPKILKAFADVLTDGAVQGMEMVEEFFTSDPFVTPTSDSHTKDITSNHSNIENQHNITDTMSAGNYIRKEEEVISSTVLPEETTIINNDTKISEKFRHVRQDDDETDEKNSVDDEQTEKSASSDDDAREPRQESSEESDEEGGGNLLTGLISSFLGSLSKPDGGVDVDAVVGLLAGLSSQKEDGTYDFTGLSELLQSFFGGGEDGGGGSDVGQFVGGLLGAFIKGVANPPGAKGAGIFTGKILGGVLPALSGPAPAPDGESSMKPQQALDSGGFLSGLLKTFLGPFSSGSGNGSSGGSKFSFFKSIFSLLTSLLTSSSGSSSSKW